ncbi:MAG: ArsR family transcriptional regulator [Halobacteriales archaeon]
MSEASRGDAGLRDCEDCLDPAEAFAIVGSEHRLAILEALWAADERPVGFSELRRMVGIEDSAGFNYHLGELRGQFVEKTDEGYDFLEAGRQVVSAILAGSFTEHPELEPFGIDGECAVCGATLEAAYVDERITVECPECGHGHGEYPFPPGGLHGRSREEVMRAFAERVRHLHCLAADGVCPECNGRMGTTVRRDPDCCLGVDVQVEHACAQCGHTLCSAVGLVLLDTAEVVTFYRDHGIDLNSKPYWDLAWCVTDEHTTVLSEDPWEVRVDIPLDEEALCVVLDGSLTILDVKRRARADA